MTEQKQTDSRSSAKGNQAMEPNFSTLALSIGSAAVMGLGLSANPSTGKTEKDLPMAQFNIDLLRMLREKTKGNLNPDEDSFLQSVITDLQLKYVQAAKG